VPRLVSVGIFAPLIA
jgi:hypothetical protein